MSFSTGMKIGAGVACGGCLMVLLVVGGIAYLGRQVHVASMSASASSTSEGWHYEESQDQMGRGVVKRAYIKSSNVVNFDSPYAGAQRGTLTLQKHPKHGNNVILEVERGQFLADIDGCTVSVRFDDGKAKAFSAVRPSDRRTTALFLNNYLGFVAPAKKAQKIYIEAEFFRHGNRVFEFDTSGLVWD